MEIYVDFSGIDKIEDELGWHFKKFMTVYYRFAEIIRLLDMPVRDREEVTSLIREINSKMSLYMDDFKRHQSYIRGVSSSFAAIETLHQRRVEAILGYVDSAYVGAAINAGALTIDRVATLINSPLLALTVLVSGMNRVREEYNPPRTDLKRVSKIIMEIENV